jgi:ABC-type multidrug transport system ATPase subunit
MTDPIVRARSLTKRYGSGAKAHVAVDAVSMTVHRGEVYGFLGPNGAGKTTTLRMLVGLVRPTSGDALVLGTSPDRAVGRMGTLIETPGFYPYLSGRENLRVLADYRGLPVSAVEDALRRVDLQTRGRDKVKGYSLGMRQRLGVAAALMGEPELVVLDEPTNGLDPAGMAEMRRLMVDLARGGQTVLLSSHMLGEVQEICDRVGVINAGNLLREDTVADLRGDTSLRLRAEPTDQALRVATRMAGRDGVTEQDGALMVRLPAEAASELLRALAQESVDVRELTPVERSLEDVFFALTTEEEK